MTDTALLPLRINGQPVDPTTLPFTAVRKTAVVHAAPLPGSAIVETLEGTLTGHAGDMLMRGVKGEYYICAKHVFEESYEPAD